MPFLLHNTLLVVSSCRFFTSAHALPPAAPAQDLAAPLNINTSIDPPIAVNCHGSFWCNVYAGDFIKKACRLATKGYPDTPLSPSWDLGPMNDTAFYAEGAHAVCIPIDGSINQGGFCIFAQGLKDQGEQPGVTGKIIRSALSRLAEKECRMCGSVGNDGWGWITANYVAGPVCGGVCPEAPYKAVEPAVEISRLMDLHGEDRDTSQS